MRISCAFSGLQEIESSSCCDHPPGSARRARLSWAAGWTLLLSLVLTGNTTTAGEVTWLSKPFSPHLSSEDAPLPASFVVELGAFADGFIPDAQNSAHWATYWRVADRVHHNARDQVFGKTLVLLDNKPPFLTTSRGYLWGYSTEGPQEWFLISDPSWSWPEAEDRLSFPSQWLVETATDWILGRKGDESSFFLKTERVLEGRPPRTTGDEWAAAHFDSAQQADPDVSGWEADPDGDGLTNLLELALGADPIHVNRERFPVVSVARVGDLDYLQMTVTKDPRATVTHTVEATFDFVNWRGGDAVTETLLETPDLLIVRDRSPVNFIERRFLRLTVQLHD